MIDRANAQPSDVAKRVCDAQQVAQTDLDTIEQTKAAARQDPRTEAVRRLTEAVADSPTARRLLRSCFGADVVRLRFIDPKRIPRTDDDWRRFLTWFRRWRLARVLVRAMWEAGRSALDQGPRASAQAALDAYVEVRKLAPSLDAFEMAFAPSPALREDAAIALSGWAATQINPQYPRVRLWKALGGGTKWEVYLALLDR